VNQILSTLLFYDCDSHQLKKINNLLFRNVLH